MNEYDIFVYENLKERMSFLSDIESMSDYDFHPSKIRKMKYFIRALDTKAGHTLQDSLCKFGINCENMDKSDGIKTPGVDIIKINIICTTTYYITKYITKI